MRRGFTLIEVNLAMLIMAVGVISVVSLFSLGYRENRQSREDVAATAVADAIIGQLTMAISATNLKWSVFKNSFNYPSSKGWRDYIDTNEGTVNENPEPKAEAAFSSAMGTLQKAAKGSLGVSSAFPSAAVQASGLKCGLVILHERDSRIVRIGFRATRLPGMLLSTPMFYTEVKFQGLSDE